MMRVRKLLYIKVVLFAIIIFNPITAGVSNGEDIHEIHSSQYHILQFEPNLKNYSLFQDIELRCNVIYSYPIQYIISSVPDCVESILYCSEFRVPENFRIIENFSINIEELKLNLTSEKQFYYIGILLEGGEEIDDYTIRQITIEKESLVCTSSLNNSIFRLHQSIKLNCQLFSEENILKYYSNQSLEYYVSKDGLKICEPFLLETNGTGSFSITLESSLLKTVGNYSIHLLVNSTSVFKYHEFKILFEVVNENSMTENSTINEGIMNGLITFSTIIPTFIGLVFLKKKNERPKSISLRKLKLKS